MSALSLLACGGGEGATKDGQRPGGLPDGGAAGAGGAGGSDVGATGTGEAGVGGGGGIGAGGGGSVHPVGCVTAVNAGHHTFTCADIVYDVEIPGACAAGGCGLIVDIHGLSMNAASEEKNTEMRARGQQHGYVVVQPTAPGAVPSWDQAKHAPEVHAFLKDAAAALAVNPSRIHAMGFSQGGGMSLRLMCSYADFYASIAPIGAVTGCEFDAQHTPSREVPVLMVHGRKDGIVNFDGTAIPQRDAALTAWKIGPAQILEEDAAHRATRWQTAAGTILEFWEHDYLADTFFLKGHCVPGSTDLSSLPLAFGCDDQGTFAYAEMAMQFFQAHPMP